TASTAIIQARGNRSFEYDWFLQLAILRYHSRDFAASLRSAKIAEELVPYSAGFVTRGQQATVLALSLAALYSQADEGQRRHYDAEWPQTGELLRRGAGGASQNYGPLHRLVGAESARLAGERIEAADLYDRAIALAREHSFVNIEALAAELAARF